MRTRQRSMRPIRQPGHRALQIPAHPTMQRRPRHLVPGGDLDHTLPGQDRPDRVQPLLNHRQDNQRHPGPDPQRRPHGGVNGSGSPNQARTVAHQLAHSCRASPGTGQPRPPPTAESGSLLDQGLRFAQPGALRVSSFHTGRFARPGADNATSTRRCLHPLRRRIPSTCCTDFT